MDLQEQFERRVDESAVAKILMCIANPPNRRDKATPGDLMGNFDFWFDDGAAQMITGWTEYVFADGTCAAVGVLPGLSVHIQFPNGCGVVVSQITWEHDKDFLKPFLNKTPFSKR